VVVEGKIGRREGAEEGRLFFAVRARSLFRVESEIESVPFGRGGEDFMGKSSERG